MTCTCEAHQHPIPQQTIGYSATPARDVDTQAAGHAFGHVLTAQRRETAAGIEWAVSCETCPVASGWTGRLSNALVLVVESSQEVAA